VTDIYNFTGFSSSWSIELIFIAAEQIGIAIMIETCVQEQSGWIWLDYWLLWLRFLIFFITLSRHLLG